MYAPPSGSEHPRRQRPPEPARRGQPRQQPQVFAHGAQHADLRCAEHPRLQHRRVLDDVVTSQVEPAEDFGHAAETRFAEHQRLQRLAAVDAEAARVAGQPMPQHPPVQQCRTE